VALIDDIQLRYATSQLRRLTTPDAPATASLATGATSKLALACDDVAAAFETEIGKTYDSGDGTHLEVACEGVIAKLSMRGVQARAVGQQLHEDFLFRLRGLRGRITPKTSSVLSVTEGNALNKPWSDVANFDQSEPEHGES
jgi:hypothetical protein